MILEPLSPRQFEEAARHVNIKPQTLELARQVLVEGRRAADVARAHAVHRQTVQRAAMRIYQTHLTLTATAPGWRQVCLSVPPDMMPEIEDLKRRIRERARRS